MPLAIFLLISRFVAEVVRVLVRKARVAGVIGFVREIAPAE
jgi:hypothetical protein